MGRAGTYRDALHPPHLLAPRSPCFPAAARASLPSSLSPSESLWLHWHAHLITAQTISKCDFFESCSVCLPIALRPGIALSHFAHCWTCASRVRHHFKLRVELVWHANARFSVFSQNLRKTRAAA